MAFPGSRGRTVGEGGVEPPRFPGASPAVPQAAGYLSRGVCCAQDRGNQQHRRGGQAGAGGRCVLRLQGPGRRHHPGHGHADRGSGGPLGPQRRSCSCPNPGDLAEEAEEAGVPQVPGARHAGGGRAGGLGPSAGQPRGAVPGGPLTLWLLALLLTRLLPVLPPPPPRQGIATGKYHAAVLTNSAEWEAACVKAGRRCGDLVHPLVYCPELHFSEFTSAVADMKNSVAVGSQGARRAPAWGNPGDPGHSGAPQIHAQGGSPQSGDGSLAGLPAGASRVTGAKGAPSLGRLPHWLQWPPGEGRPLNPRARSLGSLSAVSWQRAPTPRTLLVATGGRPWLRAVAERAQGRPHESKRRQPRMHFGGAPPAPCPDCPGQKGHDVFSAPPGPGQQPKLLCWALHRLTHWL